MEFLFDLIDPHKITNNVQNGCELLRGVLVKDIDIDPDADTDPTVFLRVLFDSGCPALRTLLGSTWPLSAFTLFEHRFVSASLSGHHCRLDLVYRSAPLDGGGDQSGSPILFTLDDGYQIDHVQTWNTGGGADALRVWYKKGTSDAATSPLRGSNIIGASTNKMKLHRVMRATGYALPSQWNAVKSDIRFTAGKICSDTWGGEPKGTWFSCGPHTHRIIGQNLITIDITFMNDPKGHFPVIAHLDPYGKHPSDSVKESVLRARGAFPPNQGNQVMGNGLTIASIYETTTFADKFNFDPSDL